MKVRILTSPTSEHIEDLINSFLEEHKGCRIIEIKELSSQRDWVFMIVYDPD